MVRPPRPPRVAQQAAQIAALLPGLVEDYRWAHDIGHVGGVGRTREPEPADRQPVATTAASRHSNDASNPVLAVLTDPRRTAARQRCSSAAKDVATALKLLEGAAGTLDRAFGAHGSPAHVPTPKMPDNEYERLLAAQRRRGKRREGWGDG